MRILLDFQCTDPAVLTAAVLHDVLEDTSADFDELAGVFGPEIARMVALLSKDNRLPEAERESVFYERLRNADWRVRLIKVADACDNVADQPNTKNPVRTRERARHSLDLAFGDEPAIQLAREALTTALQSTQ